MFDVIICRNENLKPESKIAFVVGKSGVYIKRETQFYKSLTKSKKFQIPVLSDPKEWIELKSSFNFPMELMNITYSFFLDVYKKYHSEAIVLIYIDNDNQYYLSAPKQMVSGGHLSYSNNILHPQELSLFGTIHSHGNMNAFHSSVDSNDEQYFDGLHITLGNIDKTPSMSISIVVDGFRAIVKDPNKIISNFGRFQYAKYPSEWMTQVSQAQPIRHQYTNHYPNWLTSNFHNMNW